jgi:hypothetical protein
VSSVGRVAQPRALQGLEMVAEKVSDMGCPVPSAQCPGGSGTGSWNSFFEGFCRKRHDMSE